MNIAVSSESAPVAAMSGMPSSIAQAKIVSSFIVRSEQEEKGNTTHKRHRVEVKCQWA